MRTLLADSSDEAEPVPERRVSLSRVRPRWNGYQRRALLTLADQATDDIPLRRPPARRLAADILSVVPSATIAESVDPYAGLRPTALDAASDRRRTNRVVAFVAIALGAVMILFELSGTHPSGSAAASPPVAVADSSPEVNPTVTAPPVTVGPDGVIVAGGQRYTVGEAGDQIATGDFDCNGSSTIALLRPRTGGIFVFDGWATAGADVSIGPTTVVPGAVALAVQNDGDCPVLLAVLADGSEQEVKL